VTTRNDDEGIIHAVRSFNVMDLAMNERVEVFFDNPIDPVSIVRR
jgi:hypothetical protein